MERGQERRGVARDVLRCGVVVSTVRVGACFETMAFSRGWPATGDTLASATSDDLEGALAAHRGLVDRFRAFDGPDPSDPDWVWILMDLPGRRNGRRRP